MQLRLRLRLQLQEGEAHKYFCNEPSTVAAPFVTRPRLELNLNPSLSTAPYDVGSQGAHVRRGVDVDDDVVMSHRHTVGSPFPALK